jgi:hypothetical protein
MANDLTFQEEPEADDGFHGSLNSGRLNTGNYLKWTKETGWRDRDGLTPPSPMLVLAVDEALQRWKDNKPDHIRDKPLPDTEQLNSAISQTEWERGIDGKLRKPWAHIVIVCLVDLRTGVLYKYTSPTTGAHIAYDALRESVITMRALRGTRVMPLVNLDERPMKTQFGMGRRPHFGITGWKAPGDDTKAVPAKPATPQLTGPVAASPETQPAPAPTSTSPYQAKPKPPVSLTSETLNAMSDAEPVTTEEILDDSVPW